MSDIPFEIAQAADEFVRTCAHQANKLEHRRFVSELSELPIRAKVVTSAAGVATAGRMNLVPERRHRMVLMSDAVAVSAFEVVWDRMVPLGRLAGWATARHFTDGAKHAAYAIASLRTEAVDSIRRLRPPKDRRRLARALAIESPERTARILSAPGGIDIATRWNSDGFIMDQVLQRAKRLVRDTFPSEEIQRHPLRSRFALAWTVSDRRLPSKLGTFWLTLSPLLDPLRRASPHRVRNDGFERDFLVRYAVADGIDQQEQRLSKWVLSRRSPFWTGGVHLAEHLESAIEELLQVRGPLRDLLGRHIKDIMANDSGMPDPHGERCRVLRRTLIHGRQVAKQLERMKGPGTPAERFRGLEHLARDLGIAAECDTGHQPHPLLIG